MNKLLVITALLFLLFFALIRVFSGNPSESGLKPVRGWEYAETSGKIIQNSYIDFTKLSWSECDSPNILYRFDDNLLIFRTRIDTTGRYNMYLILEDVITSMNVYTGGRLIYASGEMDRQKYRYIGNRTHYVDVSNVPNDYVYIVLFSPGFVRGINKPVYISHKFDAGIAIIRKIMPVIILTPIMIVLGLLFLLINIFRQARTLKFFSLGIFLLNLGIFSILDIANKGIFFKNFIVLTNVKYATLFLVPITLHFFVQKNFNLRFTPICRFIAVMQAVFIVSALASVNIGLLVYNDVFFGFMTLLLFSVIVVLYRVIFIAKINDADSKIILTGMLSLLGFSLHDVIINIYHIANTGEKLVWGTFTFGLSLVAITIRQIIMMTTQLKDANIELENYSINLEKEVLQRTEDLSKSRNEIEMLYRDLQYTKLLQDNDLELAKNIQRNFLLEKVPSCSSWDVAFRYIPVYDVSGDIYDFYTDENGNLSGLVLYDVSGHGVSAGLITMVTKIISFQNYTQLKNKPLTDVITSINASLSSELDKVENYLTGVIMRLHLDQIEYCNCAHPDVLIKKASTGKVTPAVDPGKKFKNFILGSDFEYEARPPVFYPVEKGDVVLLYTDSMYEEKNSSNEFYGMDRLIESFEKCKADDPDGIVDELIAEVRKFSYNNSFHDDCTIICLKKK